MIDRSKGPGRRAVLVGLALVTMMAAPVMNRARLLAAAEIVKRSVANAEVSLSMMIEARRPDTRGLRLLDFKRGVDHGSIRYKKRSSRALVRVPLRPGVLRDGMHFLSDESGRAVPSALRKGEWGEELVFVTRMRAGGEKAYRLETGEGRKKTLRIKSPVLAGAGSLSGSYTHLTLPTIYSV